MGMAVKVGMPHPQNFIIFFFNHGKNCPESLGEIEWPIKDLFKVVSNQLGSLRSFFIQILHKPQIIWPQNSSLVVIMALFFCWNVLVIKFFWHINQPKKIPASLEAVEADQLWNTLHANCLQKNRGWSFFGGHMFEVWKFYFMSKEAFMNV